MVSWKSACAVWQTLLLSEKRYGMEKVCDKRPGDLAGGPSKPQTTQAKQKPRQQQLLPLLLNLLSIYSLLKSVPGRMQRVFPF